MVKILDGKILASEIESNLKKRVANFVGKTGRKPCIATILIGKNPSSVTYVKMKQNAASRVGMNFVKVELDENVLTEEVINEINKLNSDNRVDGILLQHPVPSHINEGACFDAISVSKDVDGCGAASFGAIAFQREGFFAATPYAIVSLLERYNIEVSGKHAVVVGRSAILGKPIAAMLLNMDATVTNCHSKTKNLEEILKQADIVVAAVGKAKFIKPEWLKAGVVLLDAGYNEGNVGDIDLEDAAKISSAYTPVPGGIGPVTIMKLLEQTILSAEKRGK